MSCFSQLDSAAFASVEQTAIHRVYDAGQIVLSEGEPSVGLYIIEQGWLKAVKYGLEGREHVLKRLGQGRS